MNTMLFYSALKKPSLLPGGTIMQLPLNSSDFVRLHP